MPAKAKKSVKKMVVIKEAPKKQRKQVIAKLSGSGKKKASGAFGALGGLIGTTVGGPMGGLVGSAAGNLISTITGFGDYKVNRNSVSNGNSVATFRNGGDGMRVCHREYIADITGSADFNLASYSINPGLNTTFPWLALLAQDFEEYEMEGLVFEYRPSSGTAVSSTSSALGIVIMATDYDAVNPSFTNKQTMESYEFATSTVPFNAAMHPVECMRSRNVFDNLYVRKSSVPANTDLRLYDMGNFQIATQGMQSAYVVGELWLTYDCRFRKPRLPSAPIVGPGYARFRELPVTASTTAALFGATGPYVYSDSLLPDITGTSTYLTFPDPGTYILHMVMQAATSIVNPSWAQGANLSVTDFWVDGTGDNFAVLASDTKTWEGCQGITVTTAGTGAANRWTPSATITGACTFDVQVFQVNPGGTLDGSGFKKRFSRPSTPFVSVEYCPLLKNLSLESKGDS